MSLRKMYLNQVLKVRWNIDTQEEKKSYPSRKNSISRGRKVGQQHDYLDYLSNKLTIPEGLLGTAKERRFEQIW